MAIEKVKTILEMADKANTAVLAFNCSDFNMISSVLQGAEKANKPVICMLDPRHATFMRWITPKIYGPMVRELAEKVRIPVGIHLDHCTDFNLLITAMQSGFNSVMYDGSMLTPEENLKNTKEVVHIAKALGVDVEAELGHVGFADNAKDQDDEDLYTKPDTASRFCEESGCSSLAIAIGSAHGFYKKTPHLDLERLSEINNQTDVPLVLHGGSGIPDDQLKIAFTRGINKLNVGTELFYNYLLSAKKYCNDEKTDNMFDFPAAAQDDLTEYVYNKLELSSITV